MSKIKDYFHFINNMVTSCWQMFCMVLALLLLCQLVHPPLVNIDTSYSILSRYSLNQQLLSLNCTHTKYYHG